MCGVSGRQMADSQNVMRRLAGVLAECMPLVLLEHSFQASLQSNMTMIAEWACLWA